MRIIVCSDTHRNYFALEKIVRKHMNADMFIHLGDGKYETDTLLMKYPELERRFFYVCGNCDIGCSESSVFTTWTDEGHKIFATHGHKYGVNYGLEHLKQAGLMNNADIILYGHTHQRYMKYENGIYIMNPGSASSPRDDKKASYGIIDITKSGILMNIADV